MNNSRKIVLAGAGLAAIIVIFLVRGMLGGGTAPAKAAFAPPAVTMSQVLVASNNEDSGTPMTPDMVRWQAWPKANVDASFITQDTSPNLNTIISGAVVRAPLLAGQPITTVNIIHSNSSGVMAATLSPGMRAVSIGISTESSAGGFILPNDRVDVILTEQLGDAHQFHARTILSDVRVLAVDQTYKEDKDQKVVLAKTATLELTPKEAEAVERSQSSGTISLSLRGLGDANPSSSAVASSRSSLLGSGDGDVEVLRYGIPRAAGAQKE
jgi:pilus assembly protein CpaB